MALLLVLIFIVLPIAELYVIIKVGGAIGVLPTIALLIADSFLGVADRQRANVSDVGIGDHLVHGMSLRLRHGIALAPEGSWRLDQSPSWAGPLDITSQRRTSASFPRPTLVVGMSSATKGSNWR